MRRFLHNMTLGSKIAFFASLLVGTALFTLTLVTSLMERAYSTDELKSQTRLLLNTLPYSIRDELYFLKVDELREFAKKIGESDSENIERFVIYNRSGVILADSTSEETSQMPDPFGEILVARETENQFVRDLPDEHKIIAGRVIRLNNETIGAVSISMSTKALDKKINALIMQSFLLTTLIILAGIGSSILLSRQLSQPLRALMGVARDMAGGNTKIRVVVDAEDEIGKLGWAFNDMAEAIETRERDLRELAASLEQKVSQRTEELRQRNEELSQIAATDPLTKINNRRRFFELAETEYERAKRYHHPLSLILVDADHFKEVNDTYGHQIGDQVLINLAKFLEENVRSIDIVARYGGEEFIILMPEIDCQNAIQIAERLRQSVAENPMAEADHKIMLTISLGVACWQSKMSLSFDSLLYRADKALYQAKRDGRNRITVWEASMEKKD